MKYQNITIAIMLLLLSISMKAQTILTNKGAKINLSGGVKMSVYADFRNDGHVELDDTLMLKGNFIHSDTLSFRNSSGTIYFNGIGSQLLECSGEKEKVALPSVVINKPTGTIQLKGNISLLSAWTYIQGFIDVFTYNSWVYLTNQNNIISGKAVFDNLEWVGNDSIAFVITDTITTKDTLMISGSSPVILDSAVVYAEGNLINSNTAYNGGGTANIILMGDGEQQVVGLDSATVNAEGRGRLPNITVNKTSGSVNWKGVVNIGGKLHWQQGYGIANEYSKVVLFETDSILGGNAISEATLPAFYELKYITNHNRKLGSNTAIHKKLLLNGGSLNLNGKTLFVNTADNDVFESNAKIISTKEADQVQWLVNSDTGSYTIPLADIQGNATPVTIAIHEQGLTYQEGGIMVNTFTTNNNDSIPATLNADAQRLLTETPELVADRYWKINAVGYSVNPKATFQFKYINADIATPNTLHEDSLQLSYWKENCWEAIAGSVDTANNTFNSDTTDIYTTYVLHSRNADLLCNDGSEFNRAIMLTEADYTGSEFTLLPDSVFWLRFIADDSSMLFRVYEADTTPLNLSSIQLYSCTDTCLKTDYVADTTDKQYIKLTGLNPGYTYRLRFAKEDAEAASKFKLDHPSLQLFAEALTDEADSNGYFSLKLWYFDRYNVFPSVDTARAFRWRVYNAEADSLGQHALISSSITATDSSYITLLMNEGSYFYEIEDRRGLNGAGAGVLMYAWKMPAYNVNTFKVRSFGNVAYEDLYNESTFASASQINLDRPVGTIQGIHGTTPTGGATYTIPIPLPPGTNGMVPNIALTYNSQAGNGIAGMGWNLSGLSAISRSGNNLYHDNDVASIKYSLSDNFELDGSRLYLISGAHGQNNAVYGTEMESYSQIKITGCLFGNCNQNGPLSFEVWTKDGIKMKYGATVDARVMKNNRLPVVTQSVLIWQLNEIYDVHGNYITIKYIDDITGVEQPRVSEIAYTGTSQFVPYNHIRFEYKSRSDKNELYFGNTKIASNYLLDKIIITGENEAPYKTFECVYSKDNLNSYLSHLVEKSGTGSALNATTFKYTDDIEGDFVNSTNINTDIDIDGIGTEGAILSGDVDGDGISEIIIAEKELFLETLNGDVYADNAWKIYKRGSNGSYTLYYNFEFGAGEIPYYLADFDGDGKQDIITVMVNATDTTATRIKVYRSVAAPTYFTEYYTETLNTVWNFIGSKMLLGGNITFLHIADFNGDGAQDYLHVLRSPTSSSSYRAVISYPSKQYSTTSINFSYPTFTTNSFPAINLQEDRIFTPDFNGDGKSEIMVSRYSGSEIFEINNNKAYRIANLSFPTSFGQIHLGDFNGDKKTDILYTASARLKVALSNGLDYVKLNGGLTFGEYYPPGYELFDSIESGSDKFVIADVNADGKSDIVYGRQKNAAFPEYSNGVLLNLHVFLSKGTSFYRYRPDDGAAEVYNVPIALADCYGSGMLNIVSLNEDVIINKLVPANSVRLLEKVADGMGRITSFNYNLLTNSDFHYNLSFTYDNNIIPYFRSGIRAVSAVSVPDGIGGENSTTFKYANALLHRAGRGFLGFALIVSENATNNVKNIEAFGLSPYYTLFNSGQSKMLLNNTPLSTVTNEYLFAALGGSKRYSMFLKGTIINDYVNNSKTTTTNLYQDGHGNITSSSTNVNGLEISSTIVEYGIYSTPYKAKPNFIITYNIRSGQPAYATTTNYTYNSNGTVATEKAFAGTDCETITHYDQYDAFGNAKLIKLTADDLDDRQMEFEYDAKGRFVEEVNYPESLTMSYEYDVLWGKPVSETSVDGNTTIYEYDEWGRLDNVTMPEGYNIAYSYNWDIQGGNYPSLYKVTTTPPAALPTTWAWYDIYGRNTKTQTEGFNGDLLTQRTRFNDKGLTIVQEDPYYSGETPLTTTTEYDAFNRPQYVNTHLNTTHFAYQLNSGGQGGIKTTANIITTTPYQEKITTTDATGKVVSVTDAGGTLNYEYWSDGNQKSVKQGSIEIAKMDYDECGRQKKLEDKNAGVTQYIYDAFGDLQLQTDALETTHSMTYDRLGRILTRTGAGTREEGATEFQYYTSGNGKGQLKKINFVENSITQEFEYDQYGRTEQIKETLPTYSPFTTDYEYDDYGQVEAETYSTGFGIRYSYSKGIISEINNKDNPLTIPIFTAISYTGLGQIKRYTLGNGKTSERSYDKGLPIAFKTPYNASTPDIEHYELVYDDENNNRTWNIKQRIDNIAGKYEDFTYDNLNRLTSSQVKMLPSLTPLTAINVSYKPNGNINTKSDASTGTTGSYFYHSQKIHALREITFATNNIPDITQDITYTGYHQPETITEGDYELTYTYGPDYQRKIMLLEEDGDFKRKRLYLGSFEIDYEDLSEPRVIHYISSPAGLVSKFIDDGVDEAYYYTYTDHLGSVTAVTDNTGSIVARQNFDAWGRERHPTDWDYDLTGVSKPWWLYRGYTGHEHLPEFNLINMNGRMYDPVVGRMLSVDNFVQEPYNTQSYNRYSYAFNNPLKYTDPTGETATSENFIWTLNQWNLDAADRRSGNYAYNVPAFFPTAKSRTGEGSGVSMISGLDNHSWNMNGLEASDYLRGKIKGLDELNLRFNLELLEELDLSEEQLDELSISITDGVSFLNSSNHYIEMLPEISVFSDGYGGWMGKIPDWWGSDNWRGIHAVHSAHENFMNNPVTQGVMMMLPLGGALSSVGRLFSAARGGKFANSLFLSEKFGITSTKFGSSAAHAQGAWNQGGRFFKAGWSTYQNSAGQWGYKFRIGIGSSSLNTNISKIHLYVPKTFVNNNFANPSIQLKRSIFSIGLKP